MTTAQRYPSLFCIIMFLFFGMVAGSAGGAVRSAELARQKAAVLAPLQEAAQKDWMVNIKQDIRQREYHFHFGPGHSKQAKKKVWQAPNRKQDVRIYADKNGVEIFDRTGDGKRLLQLKTVAFGRSGSLQYIKSGRVSALGNRLEIRRPALTEWYVNSEKGIEQGFTLSRRIAGDGALSIVLDCKQRPLLIDETHLLLHSEGGRSLDYGKLLVTDAAGRKIPAGFTLLAENRFSINIDDRTATYPLTVDPIITSTYDSLLSGDQVNEYFGTSVADAGDVNGDGYDDIIVGAPNYDNGQNDEGAVFLFIGGYNGVAQDPASHWEGEMAGLQFGSALAGAGDINGDGKDDFVVGGKESYPTIQGSAIVYYGDSDLTDGLSHSSTIVGDGVNDKFAASVAGAGDVNGDGYADILIGAPGYGRGTTIAEGRAYLFYGSLYGIDTLGVDEFSFQNTGQIVDHSNYHFGSTVAGGGDINGDGYGDILVATSWDDSNTANEVYIYYGSASGISTEQVSSAKLLSPQADSGFGKGLAMVGDLNGDSFGDIGIGAPDYDADGLTNQGAIFVHFGSSTGLSSTLSSLAFKSDSNGARLGSSVSGGGDLNGDGYSDIVAGASGYQLGNGAVYIYHGHANGMNYSSTVQLAYNGIEFGADVAVGDVNGDGYADLIAGTPLLSVNQISHCGAVFIFHGGADLIDNTPDYFLESDQDNVHFGSSVSGVGDFNGDGFGDIVIAAEWFDRGNLKSGMAFLYYGPPGGLLWPFPLQLGGGVPEKIFAQSVAGAGDVNGDGFSDVIIGASDGVGAGKAYIYYGDALLNFPPKTLITVSSNNSFGDTVAGAGDVNGDGFDDVIIGDHNYFYTTNRRGRVFVFHGSSKGVATQPATVIEENNGGNYFGISIAGIGDVNGDGYSDIAICPLRYSNGEDTEGAIFVYNGSGQGIPSTYSCLLESNQAGAFLSSVSGAGDVNGDGFDDVLAGAFGYSQGQPQEGAGFLYFGSINGLANSTPIIVEGNEANQLYGWRTSGAGDVNGDGFDDILIGGKVNRTRLYYGRAAGLDLTSSLTLQSSQDDSWFGASFAGAGDVNGDGFADIIIGAREYDHGQQDEGAAFLYLGNSNGRPVRTTFLRKDGSHPIASRGLSYDKSGFQLRMDLHSPQGKEKIRIETLVCPELQPPPGVFPTCDTFISPWQDAMANYSFTINGLTTGLYFVKTRLAYAPYAAVTLGIYQPAHLCANNFLCLSSGHGPWRYLHGDRSTSVVRIGMPKSKFPWPMFLPAIINGRK